MSRLQRIASTRVAALRSAPRDRYGSPSGLLRLAIACGIAITASSASAAPPRCEPDRAIYRPTTNQSFEIEFCRDFQVEPNIRKSGVLRYRGSAGLIEYEFATTWSNGFARPYLMIIENSSAKSNSTATDAPKATGNEDAAEPADDPDVPQADGPSSVILMFDSDFGPPRRNQSWPPYLIFPDLPVSFHYWFDEQTKHPGEKIVPPPAWKLVPCRGRWPSAQRKPSPRDPRRTDPKWADGPGQMIGGFKFIRSPYP